MTQLQQQLRSPLPFLCPPPIPGKLESSDALLAEIVNLLREIAQTACCCLWQSGARRGGGMKASSPAHLEAEPFLEFWRQVSEQERTSLYQGQNLLFSQGKPFFFLPIARTGESCPIRLLLLVPLRCQDSYLGTLCLGDRRQEIQWSDSQLRQLATLATQCTLTLCQIQQGEAAGNTNKEFLPHLTHELRTPLTGILGFAKMLRDELYGPLNEKQKQYVGGILSSGEHLLALVNDFLDLSKIDANREELFLEKTSVEDLCLASLSIVQGKAEETGLVLSLEIEPDVDFCLVDQRRIKQILVNLLSNAIKFTPVGSVALQVSRQDRMLAFAVRDTGIGIKPEDLGKLFQPFQQLNTALHRRHKGTGLGLALSRQLACLHGGDLSVTSQEGQGSCFTLWLPL